MRDGYYLPPEVSSILQLDKAITASLRTNLLGSLRQHSNPIITWNTTYLSDHARGGCRTTEKPIN